MKALAIIMLFFLISAMCRAQVPADTTYQVEITVTASPAVNFFRDPRIPGTVNKASFGYGVSLRPMWHPGRLLAIGFITGYMVFAEDELKTSTLTYHARLAAIPIQAAISMQKNELEIGMGIGPYLIMSTIKGGNTSPSRGKRLELGMTLFGSYAFTIDDRIKIGPELRVVYFRYRGILSWMPSCSFRVDVLRY